MSNEEQILICAVRYALGRMSYIVSDVCEYVRFKKDELSDECKKIIVRDIKDEYQFYHRQGQMLGMECDEEKWIRLARILEWGDE